MKRQKLLQIIDANLNRTREGLRVCEDISRFVLEDIYYASAFKCVRHSAMKIVLHSKGIMISDLLKARDTNKDVLKFIDFKKRKNVDIIDIFIANIERVKESLRVLEECFKLLDECSSSKYRRLRFNVYDIEKKVIAKKWALSNHR